jgi:RNA polymerase sigma-70 factor (ECF subfamily)
MNEEYAIRLCLKKGNPRGFEFLVNQYKREAYFHALGFMGEKEDAADACQEAFTKAFMKMPALSSLDRFYPWFYTILRNHCLNLIAKKRIRRKHERVETGKVQSSLFFDSTGEGERKKEVRRALRRLQLEHREILILKYFNGYQYDEISRILSIPRGTVMSRLYNARKAFAQKIVKKEGGANGGL